ncbi:MAG: DUF5320 domain-containing protein [Chloroflexi bacterium]|nr:DUF5320 domain-containing protein [Chloroflexota bacterium]
MPRFDGTGPQGQGPMTGRGEGYCTVPLDRSGRPSYGYVGLQARPLFWRRWTRWFRPFGRGRGRGRGRWSARW